AFLHESNAIEDITNIRYGPDAPLDVGHPGAFFASQSRARAGQALTLDDLCHWQRLITEEQVRYGHGMMPEGIGVLRGPSAPIDVRVGDHDAAPFQQVPEMMA